MWICVVGLALVVVALAVTVRLITDRQQELISELTTQKIGPGALTQEFGKMRAEVAKETESLSRRIKYLERHDYLINCATGPGSAVDSVDGDWTNTANKMLKGR